MRENFFDDCRRRAAPVATQDDMESVEWLIRSAHAAHDGPTAEDWSAYEEWLRERDRNLRPVERACR
jgi:hypothetical protein